MTIGHRQPAEERGFVSWQAAAQGQEASQARHRCTCTQSCIIAHSEGVEGVEQTEAEHIRRKNGMGRQQTRGTHPWGPLITRALQKCRFPCSAAAGMLPTLLWDLTWSFFNARGNKRPWRFWGKDACLCVFTCVQVCYRVHVRPRRERGRERERERA